MSIERAIFLRCDDCGAIYSIDNTGEFAYDERADAKASGWQVNLRGGRDRCDECSRG